jgi:hypothetical protein
VIEIRRPDDGELCGYVQVSEATWQSVTVFGATMADHIDQAEAEAHVLDHGLAVLAEHWWYRQQAGDEWQVACIIEARPGEVRLALDYYPMPDVATVSVTRSDLAKGVALRLNPE